MINRLRGLALGRGAGKCGAVFGALVLVTACAQLRLPDDGIPDNTASGSTDAGGDAPAQSATLIPAGAVLGPTTNQNGAIIQTYAVFDAENIVTEVGVVFPVGMLERLRDAKATQFIDINLPPGVAESSAVKGARWDYAPLGHFPKGVYDFPHLETHLFMITAEEALNIDCKDATPPPPEMIPPTFFAIDAAVACIAYSGHHVYDKQAPEFNQQRFSESTALNYYAGQLVGLEAKILRDDLIARKPLVTLAFDRATAFPTVRPAGRYPTSAVLRYFGGTEDSYQMSYSNFQVR